MKWWNELRIQPRSGRGVRLPGRIPWLEPLNVIDPKPRLGYRESTARKLLFFGHNSCSSYMKAWHFDPFCTFTSRATISSRYFSSTFPKSLLHQLAASTVQLDAATTTTQRDTRQRHNATPDNSSVTYPNSRAAWCVPRGNSCKIRPGHSRALQSEPPAPIQTESRISMIWIDSKRCKSQIYINQWINMNQDWCRGTQGRLQTWNT